MSSSPLIYIDPETHAKMDDVRRQNKEIVEEVKKFKEKYCQDLVHFKFDKDSLNDILGMPLSFFRAAGILTKERSVESSPQKYTRAELNKAFERFIDKQLRADEYKWLSEADAIPAIICDTVAQFLAEATVYSHSHGLEETQKKYQLEDFPDAILEIIAKNLSFSGLINLATTSRRFSFLRDIVIKKRTVRSLLKRYLYNTTALVPENWSLDLVAKEKIEKQKRQQTTPNSPEFITRLPFDPPYVPPPLLVSTTTSPLIPPVINDEIPTVQSVFSLRFEIMHRLLDPSSSIKKIMPKSEFDAPLPRKDRFPQRYANNQKDDKFASYITGAMVAFIKINFPPFGGHRPDAILNEKINDFLTQLSQDFPSLPQYRVSDSPIDLDIRLELGFTYNRDLVDVNMNKVLYNFLDACESIKTHYRLVMSSPNYVSDEIRPLLYKNLVRVNGSVSQYLGLAEGVTPAEIVFYKYMIDCFVASSNLPVFSTVSTPPVQMNPKIQSLQGGGGGDTLSFDYKCCDVWEWLERRDQLIAVASRRTIPSDVQSTLSEKWFAHEKYIKNICFQKVFIPTTALKNVNEKITAQKDGLAVFMESLRWRSEKLLYYYTSTLHGAQMSLTRDNTNLISSYNNLLVHPHKRTEQELKELSSLKRGQQVYT